VRVALVDFAREGGAHWVLCPWRELYIDVQELANPKIPRKEYLPAKKAKTAGIVSVVNCLFLCFADCWRLMFVAQPWRCGEPDKQCKHYWGKRPCLDINAGNDISDCSLQRLIDYSQRASLEVVWPLSAREREPRRPSAPVPVIGDDRAHSNDFLPHDSLPPWCVSQQEDMEYYKYLINL
jgi:hypothetical protein